MAWGLRWAECGPAVHLAKVWWHNLAQWPGMTELSVPTELSWLTGPNGLMLLQQSVQPVWGHVGQHCKASGLSSQPELLKPNSP